MLHISERIKRLMHAEHLEEHVALLNRSRTISCYYSATILYGILEVFWIFLIALRLQASYPSFPERSSSFVSLFIDFFGGHKSRSKFQVLPQLQKLPWPRYSLPRTVPHGHSEQGYRGLAKSPTRCGTILLGPICAELLGGLGKGFVCHTSHLSFLFCQVSLLLSPFHKYY